MIEKERQHKIMTKLKEKGFVSVKDLMSELDASRSSIMRDLIDLEQSGQLIRQRGGASLRGDHLNTLSEAPVIDKVSVHQKEKKMICQAAAQMIHDGDCLYLDSGTTLPYIIPYLTAHNLTIVTPSHHLISLMPRNFKGQIYMLGGSYDAKYDMNLGDFSLQMLDAFNFDCAFISANGLNLRNNEIMLVDFRIAAMKKKVMSRSHHSYLLIDQSKLNTFAAYTFASTSDFDAIYIDGPCDMELDDQFIQVKENNK